MFNDPELFSCPYCGSDNYLPLDVSAGKRQKFVVDCEICCQPIAIELKLNSGSGPEIIARRENE